MSRLRQLATAGLVTDNPLTISATTMHGLAACPVVAGGDYLAITIYDPTGVAGVPEVVWLTAHTASADAGTISRAAEESSTNPARQHNQGERWVVGITPADFTSPSASVAPSSTSTVTFNVGTGVATES